MHTEKILDKADKVDVRALIQNFTAVSELLKEFKKAVVVERGKLIHAENSVTLPIMQVEKKQKDYDKLHDLVEDLDDFVTVFKDVMDMQDILNNMKKTLNDLKNN